MRKYFIMILLLGSSLSFAGKKQKLDRNCVDLHLIIMLPTKDRPGCDDFGHSGIGIGNRFYDFGPEVYYTQSKIKLKLKRFFGMGGSAYWDARYQNAPNDTRDASWNDTKKYVLKKFTCPTKIVSAKITKDEEARLLDYWERLYQNPGTFSVLMGKTCNTRVYKSLQSAGLLSGMTTYRVESLLRRSTRQLRHTCGVRAGQITDDVQDLIK